MKQTIIVSTLVSAVISSLIVLLLDSGSPISNQMSASDASVKRFIEENPEAIISSLENYQRNQELVREQAAKEAIKSYLPELENSKNSAFIGNKDGDVVVVEFFDYFCSYCKKVLPAIMKLEEKDPNVKVVLKEFPIFGKRSEDVAKASIAAHLIAPDKYFDFHKKLLTERVTDEASILALAMSVGIDSKALSSKMQEQEVTTIMNKNVQLARDIGIRGTPAFIVGGNFSPGYKSYEALAAEVKEVRSQKK